MQIRTNNSRESIRLRKAQNTLVIVGSGIMLMGVWAAVKAYSMLFLRGSEGIDKLRTIIDDVDAQLSTSYVLMTALIGVTIYVMFELGLRFYIGRCAIAEGKGRSAGRLYIFFTVMLCIGSVIFAVGELYVIIKGSGDENISRLDSATAFIIDITSLTMMVEMIVSHSKVRKYYSTHKREDCHAD